MVVAALAVVSSVMILPNDFTLDDIALIRDNVRVHDLGNLREIFASAYWPPPYRPDLYRPLALMALAGQYAIGDGAPIVFRLFTIALYVFCCLAVHRFARRLMPRFEALGAGALFAVHPVHAESLVLGVAQNELLVAGAFALAATLYLDRRQAGDGDLTLKDWAILCALYVVSAGSKEQGLILPGILLLVELILVKGRSMPARLRSMTGGYTAMILVGGLILAVRAKVLGGSPLSAMPAQALAGLDGTDRFLTMLGVVPEWFRLLLWPTHLRVDYSPSEFLPSTTLGLKEALGIAVIMAGTWGAFLARRAAPVITFGLAWAGLTLLPVSNVIIPTGVLVAERTLTSPSVGIALAIVGCAGAIFQRRVLSQGLQPALILSVISIVVTAGVVRLAWRERAFLNSSSLTLARVTDSPRSAVAQHAYAELLFDAGRNEQGAEAYRRAIDLSPQKWALRLGFASRLRAAGHHGQAVAELWRSVSERATPEGLAQLTAALIAVGNYSEARGLADRVIASAGPQPIMLRLRDLADSALVAGAPPGSVNVRIGGNLMPP